MFATNRDLESLCKQGQFRTDLFYRISDFHFHIPPLKDREADIPFIVKELCQREGWSDYSSTRFPPALYKDGNVRAIRQIILRAECLGVDIQEIISGLLVSKCKKMWSDYE